MEGIISYGFGRLKNNEGRVIQNGKERALGKYTATTYSAQLLTGYHYLLQNIELTPVAGVRCTKFKNGGYNETGTSYQNLSVKKSSYNKVELIAGIRSSTIFDLEQIILIPELYATVNYDTKEKSPKLDVRLEGTNNMLPVKTFKSSKIFWNIGTNLTAKNNNNIEYGIQYMAMIAKKYLGHQGSFKIKLYF